MKTIVKCPYDPEDFLAINEDSEQSRTYAIAHSNHGPAMTFRVDGKVAACGGYGSPWPGMAEMWLSVATEFLRCPSVIVELKRQFRGWIDKEGLLRVQATTRSNWPQGRRFLEWLGMRYEGTLHRMGPRGVDQVLYAWWQDG